MEEFFAIIVAHKWITIASLIIGAIVRGLKSDTPLPTVAPRWRPALAVCLGLVSGMLEAILDATPWQKAMAGGLVSAAVAIAGHDVIVKWLRDGRDVFTRKGSSDPDKGDGGTGPQTIVVTPVVEVEKPSSLKRMRFVLGIATFAVLFACTKQQARTAVDLVDGGCVVIRGEVNDAMTDNICATLQELAPIVKHIIAMRKSKARLVSASPAASSTSVDACTVPLQ